MEHRDLTIVSIYGNGDGAQAVFGDVRGGGVRGENLNRSHAQGLEHLPGAPVPSVRGEDADGRVVPVAGDEGAEAMPHARRG